MDSQVQWFAMRATYNRELRAGDYLTAKGLEVFIPFKKVIKSVGGVKRKVAVPAIKSLFFVKATKEALKQAKYGQEYIQYMTKREGERNIPIIVPDYQMEQFIKVVQDDTIEKTFFTPDEVNLSLGSRVKVHGGAFDGMEGVLAKIKGKRNRQFFIKIDGIVAVKTIVENAELLEVIE